MCELGISVLRQNDNVFSSRMLTLRFKVQLLAYLCIALWPMAEIHISSSDDLGRKHCL
jgi:hypothetical protein